MPGSMTPITIPGKVLPDREMKIWDSKRKLHESRDWPSTDRDFGRLRVALEPAARARPGRAEHLIPEHTPISDQGQRGTCAANAWMDALEILMGLENPNQVVQLSRLFVYWTSRVFVGLEERDDGVFLRAVAHQLRTIGVVEERYLPYHDTLEAVFTPPKLNLYTMASNYRIEGFYRISAQGTAKLDAIELAIRANHPVVSAAPVDQAFMNYRGGGQVFGPPTTSLGMHAMLFVGVREVGGKRQFLRRNSWGRAWGDDGHAWCNEAYVGLDQDVWVGTRMPSMR